MTRKRLRILTAIWWMLTIISLPVIVWYSGCMLFFYVMSGYGSGEHDLFYLILSLIPPLILAGGFYRLHTWENELPTKSSRTYMSSKDT